MKRWFVIIIFSLNCSTEKNNDLKQNIFVSAVKSAKVTVTGKVAKGKISQARVDAYRLNADGTCNTGAGNLASALTDSSGDYTLTYARTGLPICVIAVPNGSSRMYDEGTDTEIDWTGSASLTMIMREPSGSSKTGMNLTPFSRIIASRLAAIAKNNKSTSILDKQVTYANKATAVIFGFTKGFTKSLRSDSTVIDMDKIEDVFDSGINLNESSNSKSKYANTLLGAMSVAAGKTKKSSKISSDDVEKYVAALTEDIADGTADGTNSKGEALSVNGTAVGSTPLTGTLMGALAEYVSSKPSLGITTAEAAAVTFNQAPVFLQFLPVESSSNIGLAYSNTFYSLFWIGMPASITPAVKGTISSCTASPPLPAGLSISSTACVISGIPTVISAPTNYTITAANAEGRTAASLTLSTDVYRQWSEVQTNLNSESAKGLSGSETTNAFGSLAGTGKWVGGVLAPDGKIYGIPFDSTSVMELDPAANTAGTFGSLAGTAKWTGGVLGPNAKIYGIPTDSTTVLVIDPVTKTTATFGSLAGTTKWAGGVLAPNGKIYGIPQNSTSVLVIDPAANTASTFGSLAGTNKWIGGVLAPNGKIYGIPYDSTTVLVIDPAANTASTFGSLAGTGKWMEGVLAPNGKIYGIPAGATDVLVIDPASDTASTFGSVGVGTFKWTGGLLAPNGKIYGIPRYASNVLVIDPNTNTTASFASLSGSPNKWSSGMIGANGKIYGIPFYDTTVLEIDPKSVGIWPSDLYLSPYFNRY